MASPLILISPVLEVMLIVPPPEVRTPICVSLGNPATVSTTPITSMRPLVVVRLPVLAAVADNKTPTFKSDEPRKLKAPEPEFNVKLPVVEIPELPTPRA